MEVRVDIAAAFGGQEQLSKSAIAQYLMQQQPDISTSMLNWRIHDLLRRGALVSVGRGSYGLPRKVAYRPVLNARMESVWAEMRSYFPFLDCTVFHTEQLSGLMHHIPGRHFIVVEVEREVMESVFFRFKDLGMSCYLQPDHNVMQRYAYYDDEPLIVQPLVSEAPRIFVDNVCVPAIEKLLVDLVCEKSIYLAYQGGELRMIYQNAFEAFQIRLDRMLRYANRRRRRAEVIQILRNIGVGGV